MPPSLRVNQDAPLLGHARPHAEGAGAAKVGPPRIVAPQQPPPPARIEVRVRAADEDAAANLPSARAELRTPPHDGVGGAAVVSVERAQHDLIANR